MFWERRVSRPSCGADPEEDFFFASDAVLFYSTEKGKTPAGACMCGEASLNGRVFTFLALCVVRDRTVGSPSPNDGGEQRQSPRTANHKEHAINRLIQKASNSIKTLACLRGKAIVLCSFKLAAPPLITVAFLKNYTRKSNSMKSVKDRTLLPIWQLYAKYPR